MVGPLGGELDEEWGTGLTRVQIDYIYAVCVSTVTSIIRSYVKNGITDIIRYNINPIASAARHKMDGCTEAHSIQMACGSAPEGHLGWRLRQE